MARRLRRIRRAWLGRAAAHAAPPEPLSVSAELAAPPAPAFVPEPRAQPRSATRFRPAGRHRGGAAAIGRACRGSSVARAARAGGWQLPPLLVGLGASAILLGALVDRLVLRGFVLQSVAFALQPRDAVFAHEAGHSPPTCFVSPPAAARRLRWGGRVRARVVWHSAEWDLAASAADTRRHSVVLMAGIAAGRLLQRRAAARRTRAARARARARRADRRARDVLERRPGALGDGERRPPAPRGTPTRSTRCAAMARGASAGECAMVDDVVRRRPD